MEVEAAAPPGDWLARCELSRIQVSNVTGSDRWASGLTFRRHGCPTVCVCGPFPFAGPVVWVWLHLQVLVLDLVIAGTVVLHVAVGVFGRWYAGQWGAGKGGNSTYWWCGWWQSRW